ncbi:MAG: succinate dehydrogenase assembly factor 2 [Acetobacteraceae bacterium]
MSEPEPAGLEPRRRRLLYRATHRGTHEADLLIGGFVALHVRAMTDADLAEVEAVLEHPDVDLADWLTRRRPVPPEAETPVLRRMIDAAGG